jgi:ABC-2 type transport system ATP-binding protein
MALAGGIPSEELNIDAFLRQAMEYESWDDPSDRVRRFFQEINVTHPYAVRRVSEVMKWVQSGEYDRIVDGDYIRRDDERDVREEAGDAFEFYAERFRAMFAEVGENVTKLGAQVGGMAEQMAEWIGRRVRTAPRERRSVVRRRPHAGRGIWLCRIPDGIRRCPILNGFGLPNFAATLYPMSDPTTTTVPRDGRGAPILPPAIVVSGLKKSFGEVDAVRGVDFEVKTGEVFGFLGPNGAGKTTTINMLCTLTKPSGGTAKVAGHDVVRERDEVRRNIGLVFQETTLDGYLTAEQNLRLHAELYGVQSALVPARMRQVMEMVGLWERRDSPVRTFSGGMKRRLEIARGLMHSPRVLFLDEPTIGLDPQTRRSIWSYIRTLKESEEITIFMTTHYMDEAEWCNRIAIMDRGVIVALDSPEALKAQVGADRIRIETEDDQAAIASLRERFGIEAVISEGAVTFRIPSGEAFVPRLFAELGVPIRSVSVSRPTLDDVFMSYTGSSIRDVEESGTSERNKIMMQMMSGGGRR